MIIYLLHKVSECIINVFFGKDDEKYDLYLYGIELLCSSIFCSLILLLIGVFTGLFVETAIYIIAFSALKIFSGGYHANSYMLCNFITVMTLVASLSINKYLFQYTTNIFVNSVVFAITIIALLLFAPVKNKNKSINKKQYISYKNKSLCIAIIEILSFYIIYYLLKCPKISIIVPALFLSDILLIIPLLLRRD